ncbi:MAG: Rqc2 family fibronectin-binding protein [Christensenellales bacterium]|jgi:predicted ribosome quality control (RQC) complex YloA/Tae2 family protein
MPKDFVTINALSEELNGVLAGAKTEKIYEPHPYEYIFALRAGGAKHLLVISCDSTYPRIHLTKERDINPYRAPAFNMLLRKYLINANILEIKTLNNDRIVKLVFSARNELYDKTELSVIVELTGRYSNLILSDSGGRIIDAARHITPDEKSRRIILPNIIYEPPEFTKIPLHDGDKIKTLLKKSADKAEALALNTGGVSRNTAEEIIFRSNNDDEIINNIGLFSHIFGTPEFKPCCIEEDGSVKDFFVTPYKSINAKYAFMESLNAAADKYYSDRVRSAKINNLTKNLLAAVNTQLKRSEKSLSHIEERLIECGTADIFREYGDIILANIHNIKKGASALTADNFFTGGKAEIPLDIALSPQKNAQQYYKKYTKLSRAKSIVASLREKTLNDIEYLKSVTIELKSAESAEDAEAIKEELIEEKIIARGKQNNKKQTKTLRSYDVEGFKVYVGRSNLENEFITFSKAAANDIFLHASKIHGSHTVIVTESRNVPDSALVKAAQIAAYYSAARNSDKAAVDYTLRKFVKKHPSKKKGMVLYTDYKTVFVKPSLNL